ncbi:MAG: hypothetical protein ACYDBP_14695 [Leptospirales bacterium]
MSLANVDPEVFNLSGPAAIRQFFFPKQRLKINEVAPFVGLCRPQIYRRAKAGKLDLRIRYDEAGMPFVVLEDLVRYLYPSSDAAPLDSPSPPPQPLPKRGRPRKFVTMMQGQGGGR